MKSYKNFSCVYDLFMSSVPYDEWVDYIEKIWSKNGKKVKMVLELACGTGNVSIRLAKKGYEVIALDKSEDMLAEAKNKATDMGLDILFLNQDMCDFELYGSVDSIICLCDSINYITDENELLNVFKLCNNYLNPGGLFIFDVNTIYKYEKILSDNSFSESTETAAYTWENYYDSEKNINEYYVNFFIEDNKSGLYERFEEYHYQKAYTENVISSLIEKAGMKVTGIFNEMEFCAPFKESQRVFFVAEEIKKLKGK